MASALALALTFWSGSWSEASLFLAKVRERQRFVGCFAYGFRFGFRLLSEAVLNSRSLDFLSICFMFCFVLFCFAPAFYAM